MTNPTQVKHVLVLGGGSAGCLAAISLKTKLPHLAVTVLRSSALGVIGVGEGTTVAVPNFLHGPLAIPPGEFIRRVRPTYKLGLKFLWGPRPYFHYTLDPQFNGKFPNLPREPGYYCHGDIEYASLTSAMMTHDRVFARRADGQPIVMNTHAYHFENAHLVEFLEQHARKIGVTLDDDTVESVEQDAHGVSALACTSGRKFAADLFVDCSGFASLLLGKTLAEPFRSFKRSLFCDRAVVGGWSRGSDEPIRPYTTCETMNAGWCWRIDHESRINRGYVYASDFISDDQAESEFRTKNPRITETRIVKFVSGAYERAWVKNVAAIGNALGFVEPMEATALAGICHQSNSLSQALLECGGCINDELLNAHNRIQQTLWDDIRDFLAVHYRFNTRLDTEFWKAARNDVEIGEAAQYVDFYKACGPGRFWVNALVKPTSIFGPDGYLTMMIGMQIPHRNPYQPTAAEKQIWESNRQRFSTIAKAGFEMKEALNILGRPDYRWDPNFYNLFRS
jgi:tryptophan halogenase